MPTADLSRASFYIGLMSGTSLDGLDGVLVAVPDVGDLGAGDEVLTQHPSAGPDVPLIPRIQVLHRCTVEFNEALRTELLALNASGSDELHRAALAASEMARLAARAVQQLLAQSGRRPQEIKAIGFHGQTVRHRPGEFDGCGYSLQLHNASLLAELSGIDVVCDFRSRDVAAGGQGAPLVPGFHADLFARPGRDVAVLNIGGIANLTLLHADGRVGGFDCGPGNVLMDLWAQRHLHQAFDMNGAWASSGQVDAALLRILMREPYLGKAAPKSTGRDLFNRGWLDERLLVRSRDGASGQVNAEANTLLKPEDVQATLAEFTACAAAEHLHRHMPASNELLVCGGGALNAHLMQRLAYRVNERLGHHPEQPPSYQADQRTGKASGGTSCTIAPSDSRGLGVMDVEAAAFAWLAACFMQQRPGNRVEVTGALGPRVLGALYPR